MCNAETAERGSLPLTVQFSLNLQEGERLRFQGKLVF